MITEGFEKKSVRFGFQIHFSVTRKEYFKQ